VPIRWCCCHGAPGRLCSKRCVADVRALSAETVRSCAGRRKSDRSFQQKLASAPDRNVIPALIRPASRKLTATISPGWARLVGSHEPERHAQQHAHPGQGCV
jgi:hypothetical protein